MDGLPRPVYADAHGQYVLNDDGERIHGLYLLPEEECCDPPVIVDGPGHAAR
jgi:hypothetical protein